MMEARRPAKILVADDDPNVHQSLSVYFRKEGYTQLSAYDGLQALQLVREAQPDMMLLDIMMPGADGLTVCREARKTTSMPIIMLSAKGEEIDKLLGLELGADDYITKPFSPREVLMRIKVVLRRIGERAEAPHETVLHVGNLTLNQSTYTVSVGGENVSMTPKELEILWCLASNPGVVYSREHLLKHIWGYDFMGDTRAVDSHMKRIRAKLSREGNDWEIRTVWGVGYRFEKTE